MLRASTTHTNTHISDKEKCLQMFVLGWEKQQVEKLPQFGKTDVSIILIVSGPRIFKRLPKILQRLLFPSSVNLLKSSVNFQLYFKQAQKSVHPPSTLLPPSRPMSHILQKPLPPLFLSKIHSSHRA
jgi:hypothetical protein